MKKIYIIINTIYQSMGTFHIAYFRRGPPLYLLRYPCPFVIFNMVTHNDVSSVCVYIYTPLYIQVYVKLILKSHLDLTNERIFTDVNLIIFFQILNDIPTIRGEKIINPLRPRLKITAKVKVKY